MESSKIKMGLSSTYERNTASYCRNCRNKSILDECYYCGLSNEEQKEYLDNDTKKYVSSYMKSYIKYV